LPQLNIQSLRANFKEPHELLKASDGATLFIRRWDPIAGESPASVLISHGITAYSGPYGPLIAEKLASSGYTVYGMDLRGHGLSDGRRGDYPSEERFTKDVSEVVDYVKQKSKKLLLLGHSLGVLTAIVAFNSVANKVDGLILLSAAKKIRTGVYPKQKTGALLKAFFGIALFHGATVLEYKREGMMGTNDPLFNFKYSARFYSALYGASATSVLKMLQAGVITSPHLEFREKLHVPLLVGVGENDELFPQEFVKEFYEGIQCDDKEFYVIPGAKHAIFPKDSWTPLVSWLDSRFKPAR